VKPGFLAQHPHAITNVLPQHFQRGQPALIAIRLLRGFNSSQSDHRLAPRLFGRHPQSNIVFDVHLKMALDLVIEFPILALPVEQAAKSEKSIREVFSLPILQFSVLRFDMGNP
jgi:hypothetical protein